MRDCRAFARGSLTLETQRGRDIPRDSTQRPSSDAGLEQDFNSLDAQRELAEAYIKSQAHEGWRLVRERFDDGGYSGGSTDRPALQRLLEESVTGVSMLSSSTKSTGSPDRSPTSPSWSSISTRTASRSSPSLKPSIQPPAWAG